ncbi:MAG: hypothetical protein ABI384_09085, partial [Allobranchiibius sp.]
RLQRLFPGALVKVNQALVPTPKTAPVGGVPLRNLEVLRWAAAVVKAVLLDDIAVAAQTASA